MFLVGNYQINIKFGDTIVPIQPSMIQELTITQDIDRLLPTFKLAIKDSTGLLGEVTPFDRDLNVVTIEIARTENPDKMNEFVFYVDRRETNFDKEYVVMGTLKVDGLLDPSRIRNITGNVKSTIEGISTDELGISSTEVGASLNYDNFLLQPNWTNAKFLRYLKEYLLGKNEEAGYFCFIKNTVGKPTFVFKSVDELVETAARYKFLVGHKPLEDHYPVIDYKVFDNSQLIGIFGTKIQCYCYFDYETGTHKIVYADLDGYPSLTEQHLIEDDSIISGVPLVEGRSNQFTSNFKGRVKTNYYDRITGLINMWISTWGIENVAPGDIVRVLFSESLERGQLFLYQHSGYWLVKRVVHVITNSFMTQILLTRNGIDTTIETTLKQADSYKK